MAQDISCTTHGEHRATFVCACLFQTLQDQKARGINWFIDEDGGDIQAFCDACWTCDIDAFEARTAGGPKVICLECLGRVAEANGTWLDFSA